MRIITLISLAAFVASTPPALPPSSGLNYCSQVGKINEYRRVNNIYPLLLDERLIEAAYAHTLDMAKNCGISHSSCDGTYWGARVSKYYPNYMFLGENVAAFAYSESVELGALQRSPKHNDNLLTKSATWMGWYYYNGFWTQDYGRAFATRDMPKPVECGTWNANTVSIMTGNGLCLDAGSGKQGDLVTAAPCSPQDFKAQSWSIYNKTGLLQIKHSASGLCLDVFRSAVDDKSPLGLWSCNLKPNQYFIRSPASNVWGIQAFHSKKCLQSSNPSSTTRSQMVQMPCDVKQETQRWYRPNYLPWPCDGVLGSCANQK